MKKSLVLAMAMALGVTASAYAANPFSDVPAGHWAYDSINKLAAAGVIEGYGDATFGGDKLMTRYEMAQIVAKAMAKGANVDKLAAEFADELDNLGVRVANLEKKADNVKVTGEVRYKYMSKQGDANINNDGEFKSFENDLRSRIWVNGQVNDDWSYTGMIENVQDFDNNSGDEDTKFQRAYVEGKLGGLNVTAGRYNAFFANGNVYDTRADGVELSYGSKIKVTGFAGKATDAVAEAVDVTTMKLSDVNTSYGNYCGAELTGDFGKFNAMAGYVNFKDMLEDSWDYDNASHGVVIGDASPIGKGLDNAIWYLGGSYDFDGNVGVSAMYLKGDASYRDKDIDYVNSDGWTAGITYKGAEASDPGSWGLFANYYDQGGMTYVAHTTDANVFGSEGFKGYGVGANYTFAKNMVGTIAYYDTESKLDSKVDDQRFWADLTFTF